MKTLPFIVGIAAVIIYLLGYLQRRRKNIILLNATSRLLYIIQYFLLGAFEGAALDIAGIISSVLAQKKNLTFIKKYIKWFFAANSLLIVIVGLFVYENIFSLLPIIGVLLHTGAFWIDNEKIIRRISLIGCPFWLAYNIVSGAYGSCIGDVLSMVSITISMVRYDLPSKNQ